MWRIQWTILFCLTETFSTLIHLIRFVINWVFSNQVHNIEMKNFRRLSFKNHKNTNCVCVLFGFFSSLLLEFLMRFAKFEWLTESTIFEYKWVCRNGTIFIGNILINFFFYRYESWMFVRMWMSQSSLSNSQMLQHERIPSIITMRQV